MPPVGIEPTTLERGVVVIPKAKSGRAYSVPLVPAMVELLTRRKANANGSEYVFPGRRGGPRSEIRSAWDRVRKTAGLEDVRLHDLRRTLGSWQVAAGVSLPIIAKGFDHSNLATTQIYARMNLDPVRAAFTTATTAMLTAGGVK